MYAVCKGQCALCKGKCKGSAKGSAREQCVQLDFVRLSTVATSCIQLLKNMRLCVSHTSTCKSSAATLLLHCCSYIAAGS
eukprot:471619-Pelagomonas_calceolata.AAC.1